jgi:hypothetical protein
MADPDSTGTPLRKIVGSRFVENLPDVAGLTPPALTTKTFLLLDDDAQECRIISQDELEAAYVDNNISTYQLADIDAFGLQVDKEQLILVFNSGKQASILLGLVDWDTAIRADEYLKSDGIIYPVDESGNLMLNVVNTPNLVYIRKRYHDQAKAASDTDVKFATLVYKFVEAGFDPVSHLDGIGN